ncbi:MAG: 30S ribosomal protein S5 [Phycisphaeraceae bacterium]|nr:MAG: 30S ribosomal protein S5 [Phycisphaeraceae bacterium]
MARMIEEQSNLDTNTIGVFRTAATVKGGRRFSFSSLVVAGDRNGRVGLGYGKANEVPPAIEKASKEARKKLKKITLQGGTIPHTVIGRSGAASVKLIPASPGTGIVAGTTVRAVLELAGLTDCMTKSYGSNNKQNLAKAVLDGLEQLRSKSDVEALRGMDLGLTEIEERIERSRAFTTSEPGPQTKAAGNGVSESNQQSKESAPATGQSESQA